MNILKNDHEKALAYIEAYHGEVYCVTSVIYPLIDYYL